MAAVKAAAKRSEIAWIATHSFRHTYCGWMSSFGTELEVQKRAMRHTEIRTTMIYGGLSDGKVDRVLQQVSGPGFCKQHTGFVNHSKNGSSGRTRINIQT
jgi:site-specific recombinase XerD